MLSISHKKILTFFKTQAKIRLVELYLAKRYPEQQMKCPMHLCVGQEAVAAALGLFTNHHDIFMGNYRSHGHYLAKGGNLFNLFAELLGCAEGCSGGLGGSMHLMDKECGFYGSSAIVGATVPIATGIALSTKYQNQSRVVVVFFGDAAMEEGILYESVHFSLLHKLPIIYVCENNDLAIDTPLELRTSSFQLFKRFQAMDLPSGFIQDNDIENLLETTSHATHYVRQQSGPYFLEFKVSRWASHVGPGFSGPVDAWWKNPWIKEADRCPLAQTARLLLKHQAINLSEIEAFYQTTQEDIHSIFVNAMLKTKMPYLSDIKKFIYASGLSSPLPHKETLRMITEHFHDNNDHSKLVNPF